MDKLTNEQIEKLKTVQSIDELKIVLKDEEIELSEDEMKEASRYFESGKMELEDSELEMVAGGKDDYEALAKADGRIIPVPRDNSGMCKCVTRQVWARELISVTEEYINKCQKRTYVYEDAKCYGCGRTKNPLKFTLTV